MSGSYPCPLSHILQSDVYQRSLVQLPPIFFQCASHVLNMRFSNFFVSWNLQNFLHTLDHGIVCGVIYVWNSAPHFEDFSYANLYTLYVRQNRSPLKFCFQICGEALPATWNLDFISREGLMKSSYKVCSSSTYSSCFFIYM